MSGSSGPSGGTPEEEHRAPRWVKVCAVAAVVLVAVFLIAHLAGGGMTGHGS